MSLIIAIGGLLLVGVWRLFLWLRTLPVTPDPWDSETKAQLDVAQEACPCCSMPQRPDAAFCERCGNPVGPYHSYTPYIYQFSPGGGLRYDAAGNLRPKRIVVIGFALLWIVNFGPLALLYLIPIIKNQQRLKEERMRKLETNAPVS